MIRTKQTEWYREKARQINHARLQLARATNNFQTIWETMQNINPVPVKIVSEKIRYEGDRIIVDVVCVPVKGPEYINIKFSL